MGLCQRPLALTHSSPSRESGNSGEPQRASARWPGFPFHGDGGRQARAWGGWHQACLVGLLGRPIADWIVVADYVDGFVGGRRLAAAHNLRVFADHLGEVAAIRTSRRRAAWRRIAVARVPVVQVVSTARESPAPPPWTGMSLVPGQVGRGARKHGRMPPSPAHGSAPAACAPVSPLPPPNHPARMRHAPRRPRAHVCARCHLTALSQSSARRR